MIKLWHWIAGAFAGLVLLLKVTLLQRDRARDDAERKQAEIDAHREARDVEQRINQVMADNREKNQVIEDELEAQRGIRPDFEFGDSRIRLRNRKD